MDKYFSKIFSPHLFFSSAQTRKALCVKNSDSSNSRLRGQRPSPTSGAPALIDALRDRVDLTFVEVEVIRRRVRAEVLPLPIQIHDVESGNFGSLIRCQGV